MRARSRESRVKSAHVAALLVALGSAVMVPAHSTAQLGLGSLVVTMTAPANGSTVGGTVPVSASVTIIGGLTVRSVQFRLDGVNLGAEDTTAPYSIPWDTRTSSNGTHTLTAVARDLLGLSFTSNTVTVTVFNDTTAPAIAITSPTAGATLSGTTTINASASDNVGVAGVQFRLDGVNIGAEDTAAPYSIPWNTATASNGAHSLTAIARDAAGNVSTSAAVAVTVANDAAAPSVAISSPAAGAFVAGTRTVTANASDNVGVAGVQFRLDGANLGAEDTTAPYAVSWNTATAANGSHSLTAIARDAAGNVTTATAVTVTVDNAAPSVAITAPAAGATVGGTVTVAANASDNLAVAGVQFKVDGANLGAEDTAAPYSVPWNTTTASDGSHTLTAVVRDTAGNTTTSAAVTVTVSNDTAGPTVAITAPASGATVSGTTTVSATASDNGGVAGVQFRLDGVNLGAEDTAAPYAVSWNTTTVADGSHTLTAVARDTAGNTTTSAAVTVTVSNVTQTIVRVEDTSSSIAYAGEWALGNTARAWSGGTAALATSGPTAAGDPTRATLTFTGTAVRWIGLQGPQTGIARVLLDGALVATVDTYAPIETIDAVLYSVTGLASTTHTLAIESTGTRNAASSDIFIVVDAFDVTTSSGGGGSDTTAPTVAITTPANGATVSGTIPIAANASDNVGVAGVQFKLNGANLGAEDTASPYSIGWDTTTVADGSYTVSAVARDAAGNVSQAAVVVTVANTTTPPASTMTRFEDTEAAITYTDGTPGPGQPDKWWYGSRSRGWSGGTSAFNRSAGARATFRFTGTSVSWIGFRAYWAGIARVYLDGVFLAEVDLFEPPNPSDRSNGEKAQAVAFSVSGLASGSHTLAVESTGRKRGGATCDFVADPANCATDYAVVVDAFDVGPAAAPPVYGTRFENTHTSVQFTPSWSSVPSEQGRAWSGGSAIVSGTPGESVTFTFTGTAVSWIGLRGPTTGIAQVFLDGSLHAEVDTRAASELQGVIFTASGLYPGAHELRIVVGSTGTVAVDAFDVRSRFEDWNPSITYTGTDWRKDNADKAWSGTSGNSGSGTAAIATAAGNHAEFTFTGSGVTWIGYRGPLAGIAEVFLDGASTPLARVDLYSATEAVEVPVFTASGLSAGTHTLRVVVTGEKNAAALASVVVVDAFDVTLPASMPQVTRLQETDSSIAYTASTDWTLGSRFKFDSGEFSMGSYRTEGSVTVPIAGSRARLSFTGTAVRWIGRRGFATGVANVYLDGVRVATIDTRVAPAGQEEMQKALYTATGLTSGAHTVEIELIGRNGEPAGTPVQEPVWVDAFEIVR